MSSCYSSIFAKVRSKITKNYLQRYATMNYKAWGEVTNLAFFCRTWRKLWKFSDIISHVTCTRSILIARPLNISSNLAVIGWHLGVSGANYKCEGFLESRSSIFCTSHAIVAYLVLLRFPDIAFLFYKLKFCGNSASSNSITAIFTTPCAHFVTLCHILVILAIVQIFHYYYYINISLLIDNAVIIQRD
jgi:hypothetical protein